MYRRSQGELQSGTQILCSLMHITTVKQFFSILYFVESCTLFVVCFALPGLFRRNFTFKRNRYIYSFFSVSICIALLLSTLQCSMLYIATFQIERWWKELHERLEKYYKERVNWLKDEHHYNPHDETDRCLTLLCLCQCNLK